MTKLMPWVFRISIVISVILIYYISIPVLVKVKHIAFPAETEEHQALPPVATTTATTEQPPPMQIVEPAIEEDTLEDIIKCHDVDQIQRIAQRGKYWVLYNYVLPSKRFRCFESITYTTQADYTFIDNLEEVVARWKGPVSLALHAPGTDFEPTLNTIRYLRQCSSSLVSELVTFHIFFPRDHLPKEVPKAKDVLKAAVNCSSPPPWFNVTESQLYKSEHQLLYPVNVGRNIARENAVTYYVFASDIELYPNPGVIEDFLELVRRQEPELLRGNPKVFPFAVFEVKEDAVIPYNKTELQKMLSTGDAVRFHHQICPGCHDIPRYEEWVNATQTKDMHIFEIAKRMGPLNHWEPFYIGTNEDPLWDERLSWEGKSNKMSQGYLMCVLDYEFQILDNAFLIHKPGIKPRSKDPIRQLQVVKTNFLIQYHIQPELTTLFGAREGCGIRKLPGNQTST